MNKSRRVRWAGYFTAAAGVLAMAAHVTGIGPTWLPQAFAALAAFASAMGHILGDDPGAPAPVKTP